ncbi:MAG: response regulator [Oscillospiraceae bacterium]|nr:response regulator [Oscillospiraceae bacterium]
MLKVLICDDELSICRLIVRLVRWEQLGLSLAGTAQNGKDALEMIVNERPDIVLTDIRMPVYNGIELAGKARQLGLDTRFIVISGYDSFSYAQDALKASVSDYLLKPVNAQELNAALDRVVSQIRQERQQQDLVDTIENRLQRMSSAERDIFMKNVILGNASAYSETMLRACGLHFTEDCSAAFAMVFDGAGAGASALLERWIDRVRDTLRLEDYPCLRELVCYREGSLLYGILNFPASQASVVRSYLEDIYYAGRKACTVLPDLHVTLAAGKLVDAPARLSDSMQSAREALHCRINTGTDRVLIYGDLPPELLRRPRLDNAVVTRLRSCLDLCDAEAVESIIRALFRQQPAGSLVSCFLLANELLSFVRTEQSSNRPDADYTVDAPELYEQTRAALETAWLPEQLCESLLAYCAACFENSARRAPVPSDQSIELAKKYIAENYGGECSLQDVAGYAHLSPNYLSSTFKKKVGMSMNTYITVVRINEAKRLLKDSDEGIYDIGERVGYRDPKHFRKVFKDNVGISPAKYRSLYR